MSLIPDADQIDANWLTARLNENGVDCEVASFTAERVGTGQIGKCIRYVIDYARGDGPKSLIGKFPSDDPTSRATGVALKNFLKEVRFYQTLQARLTIPTPRCYFADIEGEGPNFLILMSDMSPAAQGNQLAGCDIEFARAAINALPGLHAPGWNQSEFEGLEWLVPPRDPSAPTTQDLYGQTLPGFLDRYGPRLTSAQADIIAAVGASADCPLFQRDRADPFSFIHVDYRLDNLLFDTQGEDVGVTVVDWQSITLGPPLNDVAYFIGAGLLPEVRRDHETDLVRGYHERLRAAGIDGLSWDDCWYKYRQGTFAGFGVTVIASMIVERTERGDEMFTAMASRHAQHAIDLGANEFL